MSSVLVANIVQEATPAFVIDFVPIHWLEILPMCAHDHYKPITESCSLGNLYVTVRKKIHRYEGAVINKFVFGKTRIHKVNVMKKMNI